MSLATRSACSLVVALLVCVHTPAFAATWIVDPGGGGDATTVAGGLALASYGDSVLVRAGTYFENRLMMRDGVVLRSESGPELTVLDGSNAAPVLWCQWVGPESAIEGFTITHARGDSIGGGIVCLAASSPRIAGNIIVGNRSRYGAAIGCAHYSSPVVEQNQILENVADRECGGVLGINHCYLVVSGNVFRGNASLAESGGAMWFGDQCQVTITDNIVTDNSCAVGGGGIWLGHASMRLVIERNLFARNSCGLHGGAIYGGEVSWLVIRNNTLEGNTAVTRGGGIWIWTGTSYLENNIVTHCNVGAVGTEGAATLACNDLWANPDGDYSGTITPGATDLHVDPLYCDPGADDYTLEENSPCLDAPGCGLIGAFGLGCGATATVPTTWGFVKSLYH